MFERFDDDARQVVVAAQEQARALTHNYIGTEHLLLGILSVSSCAGAKALQELGIHLDSVRAHVLDVVGEGQTPPSAQIPFTPRAKSVMEHSLRESVRTGSGSIGSEHLLLGLLEEVDGVAGQYLATRGVTRDGLVVAASWTMTPSEDDEDETANGQTGGPRVGAVEDFLAPTCPGCRAALQETSAYKDLEVPEDGGSGVTRVRVVFCEACGMTVHTQGLDPA